MRSSIFACKQAQPLLSFPSPPRHLDKAVVVVGTTGAGKSRLSIELATRFAGEVINSDKMQVYKGLDVITNKTSHEERRGVPHHLIGIVDPAADFTADDFVLYASLAAADITQRGRLPIVAGGSNSFVEALALKDPGFRSRYECCFLWVDVSPPVLHPTVSVRVDRMVERGLVEEAEQFFDAGGDYSRGIRRAIGVPEMHNYFKKRFAVDGRARAELLEEAIDLIKVNGWKLTLQQLEKIFRLKEQLGRRMHRLNATEAFLRRGGEAEEAWERAVVGPSMRIVGRFLSGEYEIDHSVHDLKYVPFQLSLKNKIEKF